MDAYSALAFLVLVVLGSYIQTVTGFAIALIIAGGATVLNLAPIAITANIISFVALANTATAVHKTHHQINRSILFYALFGILLMTGVGLLMLNHLSSNSIELLEILLGVAILISGSLLIVRPQPQKKLSSNYAHLIAGGTGGLLSGLFGVGGPPLMVHLYRQPLAFPIMRTTLLAILGAMPIVRILLETYHGNITKPVITLSLLCVPTSILATLLALRFPPAVSEISIRRFAFALLCTMGLFLIISNI